MSGIYKPFNVRHPDGGRVRANVKARWNGQAWIMDYDANMIAPAYINVPRMRGYKLCGRVEMGEFIPASTGGFWSRIVPVRS